jgi:hypothetical protein
MKLISINASTIRKNAVTGTDEPPIRIARTRADAKPVYAHQVEIIGPAKLVYHRKPFMKCGARLVLECADVKVL